MCGIVGIVSKNNAGFFDKQADIFEQFLYLDGLRGMDSTGVFCVNGKNQVDVLKQAVDPALMFRTKGWRDWKSNVKRGQRILVGHNRKATQGEVVSKNAHPFVEGNITLVHNGFIGNHKGIADDCSVDSQAAAKHLNEADDEVTGIKGLNGAWALVWYNHKKRKLFINRNDARPLWWTQDPSYLYFASERETLAAILDRNNVKYENPKMVPTGGVWEIQVHSGFRVEEKKITYTTPVVLEPVSEHWMPEENKKEAANEPEPKPSSDNTIIRDMSTFYPQRTQVLFEPEGFIEHEASRYESARTTVYGHCWLPGRRAYDASWTMSKEDNRELHLFHDYPLLATVNSYMRRNDKAWIQLESVFRSPSVLKDHLGRPLSVLEWDRVCAGVPCRICNKNGLLDRVGESAVDRDMIGHYKFTCHTCIKAGAGPAGKGSSVPVEWKKQDVVIPERYIDPNSDADRMRNELRGNTYAS